MLDGILTSIEIQFFNSSTDTLFLNVASVRVSSRNISYQYNDKFVPLPSIQIAPNRSDVVTLSGRDINGEDGWHKIAGERLSVTIKGVRLGRIQMSEQEVRFVPENPNLRK